MPASARQVHYSYAEYLALEDHSPTRHEYSGGEIYAMAGGTPDHAALAAAVIGLIRSKLPNGCRVFTSDLRVRIEATDLTTYPDAAVICGKSVRASDDPNAVINPILLVEVTSPSTEEYDRGEKLRNYQQLPTLKQVLIVSHREPRVTLLEREDAGSWTSQELRAGGSVPLGCIGASVPIDDIYRDGLEDAR